jgi:hypothetical protein
MNNNFLKIIFAICLFSNSPVYCYPDTKDTVTKLSSQNPVFDEQQLKKEITKLGNVQSLIIACQIMFPNDDFSFLEKDTQKMPALLKQSIGRSFNQKNLKINFADNSINYDGLVIKYKQNLTFQENYEIIKNRLSKKDNFSKLNLLFNKAYAISNEINSGIGAAEFLVGGTVSTALTIALFAAAVTVTAPVLTATLAAATAVSAVTTAGIFTDGTLRLSGTSLLEKAKSIYYGYKCTSGGFSYISDGKEINYIAKESRFVINKNYKPIETVILDKSAQQSLDVAASQMCINGEKTDNKTTITNIEKYLSQKKSEQPVQKSTGKTPLPSSQVQ